MTCGDETPADEVWECLTRRATVITRTEVERSKAPSVLYFADDPPNFATRLNRVEVPDETAEGFRPGDPVTLTLWRGEIREVVGEHHAWRKNIPEPGVLAAVAAALVLAAGYPAALIVLRHRDRRLPDDEVLPSAGPFAVALAGTSLWLLPLCFLYPTTLLTSPVALGWEAAGALVTVFLLRHAWRASRVRTPGDTAPPPERLPVDGDEPVFLAARFLEHTDYNPRRFGTHIAFGGGPPAVTPHGGPGRFAARRIPVERLTVREVRRVRGEDGDTVPSDWHVAELDDAGHRVRLAAPPASLARILGLLQRS